MGKSVKRYPIFKDRNPWAKQQANKKIRRFIKSFEVLPKGNLLKKVYDQYNICDYKILATTDVQIKKALRK